MGRSQRREPLQEKPKQCDEADHAAADDRSLAVWKHKNLLFSRSARNVHRCGQPAQAAARRPYVGDRNRRVVFIQDEATLNSPDCAEPFSTVGGR
jgi:hypothetical protein